MVAFRSLLSFAALVAAVSAVPSQKFKRTVASVEKDISVIASTVKSLDKSLKAFPDKGATLIQAFAIHQEAQYLIKNLTKATTDAKAVAPFSESNAKMIIKSVQAFVPTVLDALKVIVKKKPAFKSLPVNVIPLVQMDLNDLANSTAQFEKVLIAKAPADLKKNATAIKTQIDAAFKVAIKAYAS